MWYCKACRLSFITESVEQHVYTNHMKPKVGSIKVYICGECMFTAEGFEDIALHCINLGHQPTQVFKGLNYDEYASCLFTSLEETMFLTKPRPLEMLQSPNSASIQSKPAAAVEHINWSAPERNESINNFPKTIDTVKGNEEEIDNKSNVIDGLQQYHEILVDRNGNDQLVNSATKHGNEESSTDTAHIRNSETHKQTSPQPGLPKPYTMPPNVLPSLLTVDQPTSIHQKSHRCLICQKSFPNSYHLKRHEPIHTGEKPFSCSYCGKKFILKHHLKGHERVHTGEKPYSCSTCEKAFNKREHLKRHERVHTGEKPFSCSTCGKAFRDGNCLRIHKRIHVTEKPF